MDIRFDIKEIFTSEEMREIAEDELRQAFRSQFRRESDVERVIVNLSLEYVFALVSKQWDGDFEELLRQKVREALSKDLTFQIFRRSDAWGNTESPAIKIFYEEIENSRPLLKAAIEKRINEYPFQEFDREFIQDSIYTAISDKLWEDRRNDRAM